MSALLYVRAEGMRCRAAASLTELARSPVAASVGNRIVDVNDRAAAAGVRPGISLQRARRVCPDLRIFPLVDDARLQALSEGLCRALFALTPLIAPDGPAAVFARITGRLAEEPRQLAAMLTSLAARVCPALAERLTVGIAETRFAARLLVEVAPVRPADRPLPAGIRLRTAADGRLRLVTAAPGGGTTWLSSLPVMALWPLPVGVRARLLRLGLRTLADVKEAGRFALMAALGEEGARAFELACGRDQTPFRPGYPPREVLEVRQEPEGFGGLLSLERAAADAAIALAARLWRMGEGARQLWLTLQGDPVGAISAWRAFSLPTARPEALAFATCQLLRDALSRGVPRQPEPRFDALYLAARSLAPLPAEQQDVWAGAAGHAGSVGPVPRHQRRRWQLVELVAHLRRRFPQAMVRIGTEVAVPRRERLLACWDPYRFAPASAAVPEGLGRWSS